MKYETALDEELGIQIDCGRATEQLRTTDE